MISQSAQTDKMMILQVISALEKRQLLKRRTHPQDARAYYLTVTGSGYALVSKALKVVEDADAAFFGRLDGNEIELCRLLNELSPPM